LTSSSGKTWKLEEATPTIEDYYTEAYEKYAHDPEKFFGTEAVDSSAQSTLVTAQKSFIIEQGKAEPEAAAGVPNIAGIKKLDKYTVEVTLNGFSAPAVYQIFGVNVDPLHYYGDPAQYDYDNNKFGHPFGDLSLIQAKTTQPMGAGPYKFVKYENKVVYLEANDKYFMVLPKSRMFS
jgi:peptide/nickel transport system substrate-binding protein